MKSTEVESAYSSHGSFREWSAEIKVDFAVFFVLFYGVMVGKYALICGMEIQKIHVVVHIFSGFALFMELHVM